MTEEQLAAMEAGAPLLVDEYRKLQGELHETIGENADLEVERRKWEERAITAEHGWYEAERQRKILEASYEALRLRYAQAQLDRLSVVGREIVEAAGAVADAGCPPPDYKAAWRAHQRLLAALGRTT